MCASVVMMHHVTSNDGRWTKEAILPFLSHKPAIPFLCHPPFLAFFCSLSPFFKKWGWEKGITGRCCVWAGLYLTHHHQRTAFGRPTKIPTSRVLLANEKNTRRVDLSRAQRQA